MSIYHHIPIFLFCVGSLLGCGEEEERVGVTESAASLPGSRFEIDTDANLRLDAVGFIDWATLAHTGVNPPEIRTADLATGQNDDSYGGGAKEDDTCPPVGTGSIPNNKSDLLFFGVNVEQGTALGSLGFLNLFWARVSDPSGTTLMDFEFNQSRTRCSPDRINPERTVGDLLIEYAIDQGGAVATITKRQWTGSAWSAATALTNALGTINTSLIPAAESDGLGERSARTFGEASIDLTSIFPPDQCVNFGSAFVKSRASDSFTSALKDFIAPVPITLSNCGKVIIRKQTEPPGLTGFEFSHNLQTTPPQPSTFTLDDDGVKEFTNVLLRTGYTVTETVPVGFELRIDCSASSPGVLYTISGSTVSFDLTRASEILDCTYTNRQRRGAIRIEKSRKHAAAGPGDHPHAGVSFEISGGGLGMPITTTTNSNGVACVDGLLLSDVPGVGDYSVSELVPAGYVPDGPGSQTVTLNADSSCTDPIFVGSRITFKNIPLTTITVGINSLVDGGTASTISCGELGTFLTGPGGDGEALLSSLRPGTYTCTIVVDP